MLDQTTGALEALSKLSPSEVWETAGLAVDDAVPPCTCPLCTGTERDSSESEPIGEPPTSGLPPSFSLGQIITQLRTSWGGQWENDTYPVYGTSISYAILTSAPNDSSSENSGWQAMTSLMAARATEAFEAWDELVPLNLDPYSGNPPSGAWVIQFGYSSTTSGGGTYERPELGYYQGTNEFGGDYWQIVRSEIWLNSSWSSHSTSSAINQSGYGYYGGYGLITYLHEIGHALGLSHPGSYNAGSGTPTYANSAEYLQDTRRYSLMSYWNAYEDGSGTDHWGSDGLLQYAQTPMVHDVAAAQLIYGADATTRTGDTTYGFNSTAGKDVFDFTKNTNPILTIYDAAGTDTIDLSGFSGAQRLDLTPGSYSDVGGYMTNNLGIAFSATIENAVGGSGNDTIVGNAAANALNGGGGADSLSGLGGDDTLIGDDGADTMYGGEGNDNLDGGAGDDFMRGGTGNDSYLVHNQLDNIAESAGEGTDTVVSLIDWALGDNFEFLDLAGATVLGVGNGAANEINGNAANNWLDGKGGADTMRGGAGDDTYVFETIGDFALEAPGDGLDTVIIITAFDYTLASNVERLWLGGSGDFQANGNDSDNEIIGNGGNNILNGGLGSDTMYGGQGNDLYLIDNSGDVVNEAPNAGTDTVNSLITYTISADVENANIIGTGSVNAYGNNLGNVVNGNSGDNTLTGEAGNDTLSGGGGVDTIHGGDGNDWLDGQTGVDTMRGGAGDDTYVFESTGDVAQEAPGDGLDTVLIVTAFDYTLASDVERLWLGGSGDFQANGNDSDNEVIGNGGNNILNGGLGADTMYGGQGNDLYLIDDAGDVVSEAANAGTDTVNSLITYTLGINVENLNIIGTGSVNAYGNGLGNVVNGNGGDNTLTGEAGNDMLSGGGGADWLDGGTGTDTLGGGSGDDLFVFGPGSGHDTIQDFSFGAGSEDKIDLSQYGFADFNAVLAATSDVAGSAVITLAAGDDITLSSVLKSQLHENDFLL